MEVEWRELTWRRCIDYKHICSSRNSKPREHRNMRFWQSVLIRLHYVRCCFSSVVIYPSAAKLASLQMIQKSTSSITSQTLVLCCYFWEHLSLDQQTCSTHLFRLVQAHGFQYCWRNVPEDSVLLLQAPALRGIGHDEWDIVGRVRRLWLAFVVQHLFSIATLS